LVSTAAWADGIDPKVIIQGGGGSTPITVTNPNPTFSGTATQNSNCLSPTDACYYQVFQNQTGQTLHSLTINITDLAGFVFSCGDLSQISFFSACSATDNGSVTSVFFSGGTGIAAATKVCVPDNLIEQGLALLSPNWCTNPTWLKLDPDSLDDLQYTSASGGEFALLIDGNANYAGQSVVGQTVSTPEPGTSLLVLFGALAFGGLLIARKGVLNVV
jgi:hypothetical protein